MSTHIGGYTPYDSRELGRTILAKRLITSTTSAMRVTSRLQELGLICAATQNTIATSRLPTLQLNHFVRNKMMLVWAILQKDIFPFDAGFAAPSWNYWVLYSVNALKGEGDFYVLLKHILDGFMAILSEYGEEME